MHCFQGVPGILRLQGSWFFGSTIYVCDRRFDGNVIWVRLDRALATSDWVLKFPLVRLHHLSGFSLDHKPIWLCFDNIQSRFFRP